MRPTDFLGSLTADRLKSLLKYEPETGIFTWLVARSRNKPAGTIAGSVSTRGYCLIRVDGRRYYAHRLAWLYMVGEWPSEQVDHADTDKLNNCWRNLRAATHAQNISNRAVHKTTESGLKGAYYKRGPLRAKPWASIIKLGPKTKHLGYFHTPEEANAAYAKAAGEAFGDFARS